MPDTYVFRVNDMSLELCIVSSGVVELTVTSETEGERVEAVLSNGDVFGEIAFLFSMRQPSHARTPPNMTATLFCLRKQDWHQLAKLYQEEEEQVVKNTLSSWDLTRSGKSGQSHGSSSCTTSTVDTLALDDLNKVMMVLDHAKKKKHNEKVVEMVAAASKNNIKEVSRILTSGDVDVNEADYDQRTALHLACSEGHAEMTLMLLDVCRASMLVVDRYGGTPMMDAVRHHQDHIAQLLRNRGAKLEVSNPAEQLCSAAAKGDREQLQRLVENKLDANLKDYNHRTALHLAASNGHLHIIQYLVEIPGLDLSPMDRTKGTPLQDAIDHKHVEVQRFLLARGASMGQLNVAVRLCTAAFENNVEQLQTLHANGIDLNSGDYDARTALHLGASEGCVETVSWLLTQQGVDVNPVDRLRNTPLDDAMRQGHEVCALLLKERGGLRSGHPSLVDVTSLLLAKREEEAAKNEEERLKSILEKAVEESIVRLALELSLQLEMQRSVMRSKGALLLQFLGELIDFHSQKDTTWGATQVATIGQLQKVAEQLVACLKTVREILSGQKMDISLISKKSRLVDVLAPNLKACLTVTCQHLSEIDPLIPQLIKEGLANDFYFDIASTNRKGKYKRRSKLTTLAREMLS
eukprot:CAMPEP_0196573526 /NCGR_PEP_ID=MMETSP1081-20130531/3415_1 /TAXON_ID=36882 /ORGANISM="Pyramimonas amylifera, Strain CCMP720" /LENGTH=635 /DNA_ID=CAMNT_0041891265 /DNA_START=41 /DNA_END=1948 /DNA_ORIENTATION=-